MMMCRAFVVKHVVRSSASTVNNRRGLSFKPFYDAVHRFSPKTIAREVLNRIPHTLCVTFVGKGSHPRNLFFDDDVKCCLNIPGNEKKKETDETLCISLDLGMEHDRDFNYLSLEAELTKDHKALIVKAYVQKQDIRRDYTCRVNLQTIDKLCEPIKTEVRDGYMVVTIPKVMKQKQHEENL